MDISYKFHRIPSTWFDARRICQKEDATLAIPKNLKEVEILLEIFQNYPISILQGVTHPDFILLDFHDMFNEGEYLTESGKQN